MLTSTRLTGAAGIPSGTYDLLSFYSILANLAWSIWDIEPDRGDRAPGRDVAAGPARLAGLDGPRRFAQPNGLAAAAAASVAALIIIAAFDNSFFEVRDFLILAPLVLLLVAR